MTYQFDTFEVDDREFRLMEGGAPVQVEPKVLRLLLYLIEHRNRLVRKQELLDKVWQDAMVTENALTRVIGLLRKALNDDSHVPRFIETVPTAGYRFIAKVTAIEESPAIEPTTPAATSAPAAELGRGFRARKWILVSVVALLTLVGAAYFFVGHHRRDVTEKDTVVLADFDNATGDPVFDSTLRQGTEVQLRQSPFLSLVTDDPFLSLVTDDRTQQVLRMMGQPPDARLTPAIAREICKRNGSTAVLEGSIAPLGSQYVVGLRATDCLSGRVLAEDQVQAARKEDVLNALDQAVRKVRTRLGESLATVEKYDTPLVDATTPSLEALNAYSLGQKKAMAGELNAALPFFNRAIELDPNFAMAYAGIASIKYRQEQPERAAESLRKAYELREKVSEREKFIIESIYYQHGTGEQEKTAQIFELWKQAYPRDLIPYDALSVIYRRLGNTDKALDASREALHLAPTHSWVYQNLAANYVNVNRLDEADAVYKLAEERHLTNEGRLRSRYLLAFLKGDTRQMAQLASAAIGKPGDEDLMLAAQSDTEAWYGKFRNARELVGRAMDSAQRNDAKETAARYQAVAALYEADSGNREQARADADAAMKLAPTGNVKPWAATAFARIGDTSTAEKLAAELDNDFHLDTKIQTYWLPAIHAAIAIERKDPGRAIELLQATGDMELVEPSMYPVYLRGEAYLMLHDGNHAATEFQKYIDHYGLVRNAPWGAMARLGLARAYAAQGNTVKARAEYQDFLTLWKEADPDLPILKQAEDEYAKLQ